MTNYFLYIAPCFAFTFNYIWIEKYLLRYEKFHRVYKLTVYTSAAPERKLRKYWQKGLNWILFASSYSAEIQVLSERWMLFGKKLVRLVANNRRKNRNANSKEENICALLDHFSWISMKVQTIFFCSIKTPSKKCENAWEDTQALMLVSDEHTFSISHFPLVLFSWALFEAWNFYFDFSMALVVSQSPIFENLLRKHSKNYDVCSTSHEKYYLKTLTMCFECLSEFTYILRFFNCCYIITQAEIQTEFTISRVVSIILTTQEKVCKSISWWLGWDLSQSTIKLFDFFSFLSVW